MRRFAFENHRYGIVVQMAELRGYVFTERVIAQLTLVH